MKMMSHENSRSYVFFIPLILISVDLRVVFSEMKKGRGSGVNLTPLCISGELI